MSSMTLKQFMTRGMEKRGADFLLQDGRLVFNPDVKRGRDSNSLEKQLLGQYILRRGTAEGVNNIANQAQGYINNAAQVMGANNPLAKSLAGVANKAVGVASKAYDKHFGGQQFAQRNGKALMSEAQSLVEYIKSIAFDDAKYKEGLEQVKTVYGPEAAAGLKAKVDGIRNIPGLKWLYETSPGLFNAFADRHIYQSIMSEFGLDPSKVNDYVTGLKGYDMNQYIPGMAAAFGIPLGIGALTGHPGWGLLLGMLGAGAYGYAKYNHIFDKPVDVKPEETPASEAPATTPESSEDLDAPASPETTEALPVPAEAPAPGGTPLAEEPAPATAPASAPAVEEPAPAEPAPDGGPRARSIFTDAPLDPEDQSLVDEIEEWSANPESKSEPDVVAQPEASTVNPVETPVPAATTTLEGTSAPAASIETPAPSGPIGRGISPTPVASTSNPASESAAPPESKPKLQPLNRRYYFENLTDLPEGLQGTTVDENGVVRLPNGVEVGKRAAGGNGIYIFSGRLPEGIDLDPNLPGEYNYDQKAFRDAYPDAKWAESDDFGGSYEILDENGDWLAYTPNRDPDAVVRVGRAGINKWNLGTDLPARHAKPGVSSTKPQSVSKEEFTGGTAKAPGQSAQSPIPITQSTFAIPPVVPGQKMPVKDFGLSPEQRAELDAAIDMMNAPEKAAIERKRNQQLYGQADAPEQFTTPRPINAPPEIGPAKSKTLPLPPKPSTPDPVGY